MEKLNGDKTILAEIIQRFTEPIRYKLKFYQIAVIMFIDHFLSQLFLKIEQNKTNEKIIKFQSQIKLDLFSKENISQNFLLFKKCLNRLKESFGIYNLSFNLTMITKRTTNKIFISFFYLI